MNKSSPTSPNPSFPKQSSRRKRERIATGVISADPTLALAPSGKEHLESDIQHRVIDAARARGCYVRKVQAVAYRGFPDLIVIRGYIMLFWEIKARKGTVTKIQKIEHQRIADVGGHVAVTFGLVEAMQILDAWFP